MQEQIFLLENGVTVTQTRFVTPNQTFAMQGITSVAHSVSEPSTKGPIGMMLLGALMALIGLIVILAVSGGQIITGITLVILGVALAGQNLRRYLRLKPDHQVILNASTTAGTSRTVGGGMLGDGFAVGAAVTGSTSQNFTIALSSKDGEFVNRVVNALNEALVARG